MPVSASVPSEMPWVEKYRPKSLKEVASQTFTVKALQEFVARGSIPHLIFTGPAGTGKTSAAMSLIYDLIGEANITQDMILERNASDDVRMGTRDEIKNFVNYSNLSEERGYKFVILDEADNISRDMQGAFRRIIEMAPPNVKFIFMCNYVENIIDPVLSRCAIFRFYPLPKQEFGVQLRRIAAAEGLSIREDLLDAIFFISQGDMRQAINLFQMSEAYLENTDPSKAKSGISADLIYQISGFLPDDQLNRLFSLITARKFLVANEYLMSIQGYSSRAIFRQITQRILTHRFPEGVLEPALITIAEYDYRLTLEADPMIQISGFLAEMVHIIAKGGVST